MDTEGTRAYAFGGLGLHAGREAWRGEGLAGRENSH